MFRHYDKAVVKQAAQDRIVDILEQVAGISHEFLLGNHPVEGEYHNGPCPKCGGRDRFRLINKEIGTVFCNQCLSTGNGDFLGAVRWMKDCSFSEAVDLVGKYLDDLGVLTANTSSTSSGLPAPGSSDWPVRDLYGGQDLSLIEKVYLYYDPFGNYSYKIERFRRPDGRKWFCQWHYDQPGRKWVRGLGGQKFVPLPYNLKSLLNKNLKMIFIAEGEKCVDALTGILEGSTLQYNTAVTTIAGGCHQWRYLGEVLESYRPDCPVYFFVDHDESGEKAVQAGFESLRNADLANTGLGECNTFEDVFERQRSAGRPNTTYYRIDFPTPVDPDRPAQGYDVADFLEDLARQGCSQQEILFRLTSYIKENKKEMTDEPQQSEDSSPPGKEEEAADFDASTIAEVELEDIQWLWENKIPRGMITLLAGRGGEGKSYFSAYLASQISRGGVWPDGSPVEKGCTVFLGPGEDPLPQIVRPRLETLDADLSLICEFRGVFRQDGPTKEKVLIPASLKRLSALKSFVHYVENKTGFPVRLLVIDPVSSFLDGTQENNNAEIRELLKPLVSFAAEENIAVLLISHFRKGTSERGSSIERVIGSAAFTTSVRAAWFLYADNADHTKKMVVPAKANVLTNPTGLEFQIQPGGWLDFTNPFLNKTAEDIDLEQAQYLRQLDIAAAEKEKEKKESCRPSPTRDAAEKWLINYLQDHPNGRTVNEIKAEAMEAGFNFRTVQRAAGNLNIVREKQLTGWVWKLLSNEE